MVSSISGSGVTAYTKSAQLGGGQPSNFKRPADNDTAEPKKTESKETVRSTDKTDSVTRAAPTTEIQARNETETIQTEQTRGSLLDIAV